MSSVPTLHATPRWLTPSFTSFFTPLFTFLFTLFVSYTGGLTSAPASVAASGYPAPEAMTTVTAPDASDDPPDPCDICGSTRTVWRKCKLVCLDCSSIVKSCADL